MHNIVIKDTIKKYFFEVFSENTLLNIQMYLHMYLNTAHLW